MNSLPPPPAPRTNTPTPRTTSAGPQCLSALKPTRKRAQSPSWLSSTGSFAKRPRPTPSTIVTASSSTFEVSRSPRAPGFNVRPLKTHEPYDQGPIYHSSGILNDDGGTVTDPSGWMLCQPFKNKYDPVRDQYCSDFLQNSHGPAQYRRSKPNKHDIAPSLYTEASNHYTHLPEQRQSPPFPRPPPVCHSQPPSFRNWYTPPPSRIDCNGSPPIPPVRAPELAQQRLETRRHTLPSLSASEYLELVPPQPSFKHLQSPIYIFRERFDRAQRPLSLNPKVMACSMEQAAHRARREGFEAMFWPRWANYYQTMYCLAYNEIQELKEDLSSARHSNRELGHLYDDATRRAKQLQDEVGHHYAVHSQTFKPEDCNSRPRKLPSIWPLIKVDTPATVFSKETESAKG
ncbi:hypothetical protein QBC44DRAFT_355250 [Cladorrhinum sp. PSN332]|nr:hypothetical protein QBC44DRAFT_355250 [Cladorrhinum sp. PSN332]